MKEDNTLLIVLVVLILVLLFGGFGMMGFGGMMNTGMMGYGNPYLCSQVGGIWCYFPIFSFILMLLFIVAFILLVVWLVKKQGNRK